MTLKRLGFFMHHGQHLCKVFAFQIQMAFELEQGKELRKAVHIRLKGLVSEMCYWNCSIQKLLFINTLKYNSEKELLYN